MLVRKLRSLVGTRHDYKSAVTSGIALHCHSVQGPADATNKRRTRKYFGVHRKYLRVITWVSFVLATYHHGSSLQLCDVPAGPHRPSAGK